MLVATDLQRLERQRQLGMIDAAEQHHRFLHLADQGIFDGDDLRAIEAGASAIAILVRQRRATVARRQEAIEGFDAGEGCFDFSMTPALMWLLWSRDKVDHVRLFVGECEGDRTLRRLSEEAGIDVDGWQEALENGDRDKGEF